MCDVYYNVADLAKTVRALIEAKKFRNHGRSLGAEFARRDMGREGGVIRIVFEEGAEEVDVEKLKEHAAKSSVTVGQ
jgi:hypothetical protein